ncbi:MAG: Gar1/Naf1 family protein [Candidatus Bathyarchaeota archaeon]|nr:Gar1/Naf1 family protein [Candidatus Bathyarchaeota archaeon]
MLHVSTSGNLIVRARVVPRIGAEVMDENLKPIGKVFDVIGSVKAPYVAVRPAISDPQRLVRHAIYTSSSTGRRKEKRRFGR